MPNPLRSLMALLARKTCDPRTPPLAACGYATLGMLVAKVLPKPEIPVDAEPQMVAPPVGPFRVGRTPEGGTCSDCLAEGMAGKEPGGHGCDQEHPLGSDFLADLDIGTVVYLDTEPLPEASPLWDPRWPTTLS